MFPPGNLPAERAVPAHRGHRASWYAPLVGPFLVGAAQLAAVDRAGDPGPVVLVLPGGPETLGPALAAAQGAGLRVVGAELACGPGGHPVEAVKALDAMLPELPAAGVVEIPRDQDLAAALDAVADSRHRAKLRTGGTVAEAFPSVDELARFVRGCVARGLPFKCTAGLHRAVRHTDPRTGFTHHGFLNILAATYAALDGADPARVRSVLDERDGRVLAAQLRRLSDHQVHSVREMFTAYGTCDIAEPLHDLAALGLIAHHDSTEPA
ncbi:hypothetical protein ACEZDB_15685 [Streptacidiphilus sp. N1-3]|uniref:Uncharacterized protein n=1 Tax=Streptacidiphilus alkalitolerans TaxID=3342712 RepID=A0ABV6X260_9ACTN